MSDQTNECTLYVFAFRLVLATRAGSEALFENTKTSMAYLTVLCVQSKTTRKPQQIDKAELAPPEYSASTMYNIRSAHRQKPRCPVPTTKKASLYKPTFRTGRSCRKRSTSARLPPMHICPSGLFQSEATCAAVAERVGRI